MKNVLISTLFASSAVLSACGSSSGTADDGGFQGTLGLVERSQTATAVAVEDLPSSASLNGGIQVARQEDSVLGKINVEADFTTSTVTGSTSDLGLYEVSGSFGSDFDCQAGATCSAELVGNLDGALALNGTITGNTFGGTLNGDLTGSNAEGSVASTVALNVDGRFLSDSAGLVARGNLSGTSTDTITSAAGTTTEQVGLSGVFVAAE